MDLSQARIGPFEWRDAPRADFAVLGDPIDHSLSPRMHAAAYAALNLQYSYVALRVQRHQLADACRHLANLGYRGANVTIPLKQEAVELGFQVDEFARLAGAANTLDLANQTAINTDGPGMIEVLESLNIPQDSTVFVLGAGGSARAIVAALVLRNYRVRIWNRTVSRAHELVQAVGNLAEVSSHLEIGEARIVINATSASLSHDHLNLVWPEPRKSNWAIDLMYNKELPFLVAARECGWNTMDGLPLLIAQGALAFEHWLDKPAPRDAMRNAVSENF